MKIVTAIDSFKGSLSSLEASRAAKAGIEKVCYAPEQAGKNLAQAVEQVMRLLMK